MKHRADIFGERVELMPMMWIRQIGAVGQRGKQMQILKEKIVRYETDGSIVKGYDAGELIRCKDCKWADWYTAGEGRTFCYCLITDTGGNEEDDFCSSAMRAEE